MQDKVAVFIFVPFRNSGDREDDKIGLINDRQNIICFSDEAHRTQLEHSKKIQFSKDADENMKLWFQNICKSIEGSISTCYFRWF